MSRHVVSPRARRDLDGIYDYTVDTWGVDQAERYALDLRSAIDRLAAAPSLGPEIEERPALRRYRVASHVVIYAVEADHIRIVRVLHARMDLPRRLG